MITRPAFRPISAASARAVSVAIGEAPYIPTIYLYQRGIAWQGLESEGTGLIPGVVGTDFRAPKAADFDYIKRQGFKLVRIGALWERLQRTLFGPLNAEYLGYIKSAVTMAKARGMQVVLDPCHNYGTYRINGTGYKVGTPQVPVTALADICTRVANEFKNEPAVYAYDVMNEPIAMPVECSVGTYLTTVNQLQLIPNWKFEVDLRGWSADGGWSRVTDPTYNGGLPAVRISSPAAGTYDNFTTSNDAESGLAVLPSTTYTLSGFYRASFTGNYPQLQVNTGADDGAGHAYPGSDPATQLGSLRFTKATDRSRWSLTFTTGAATTKVWIRGQNLGGVGEALFDGFNLTKDATVQPYRDHCWFGAYATTSVMYQAAIDAIRATGFTQWIWIEPDKYAGPHQWRANYGPNPTKWFNDPLNKTAVSLHYYLDPNHSGGYKVDWEQACDDRLESDVLPPLVWGEKNNVPITFGEIGWPSFNTVSGAKYRALGERLFVILDRYKVTATWFAIGDGFTSETSLQPSNDYLTDALALPGVVAHPSVVAP